MTLNWIVEVYSHNDGNWEPVAAFRLEKQASAYAALANAEHGAAQDVYRVRKQVYAPVPA